jgi:hypothetical protein
MNILHISVITQMLTTALSNKLNFFTPTAVEATDLAVRIVTPDLRGLNYCRRTAPLLMDTKGNEHCLAIGKEYRIRTGLSSPG